MISQYLPDYMQSFFFTLVDKLVMSLSTMYLNFVSSRRISTELNYVMHQYYGMGILCIHERPTRLVYCDEDSSKQACRQLGATHVSLHRFSQYRIQLMHNVACIHRRVIIVRSNISFDYRVLSGGGNFCNYLIQEPCNINKTTALRNIARSSGSSLTTYYRQ